MGRSSVRCWQQQLDHLVAGEVDAVAGPVAATAPKPRATMIAQFRGRFLARLGWGLADQGVSSLSNVAVSLYLAHTLSASAFGAFSLAYVTYGFALNASRGLSTDPLMVRFSGAEVTVWRRAVAACTATGMGIGVLTGALALVAAALLAHTVGVAFLALGLTLPGLMLQDAWRFSFFAHGRGDQAFISDVIWAVGLGAFLVLLRETGHASVFSVVFAWGTAATLAAAVGPFQARVVPDLGGAWPWVVRHRDLGPNYLAVGLISNASSQMRSYSTGIILSIVAVGYLQAVTTLMGPVNILFAAAGLVLIPEAARVLRRRPNRLRMFCILMSVGMTVLSAAWGIVLLIASPMGLGHLMLGALWRPTYPLIFPALLAAAAAGSSLGPGIGLRALGASRQSLSIMIIGTAATIGVSLVGAVEWGVVGTMWGGTVGGLLGSAVAWWQFEGALKAADIGSRHRARHRAGA